MTTTLKYAHHYSSPNIYILGMHFLEHEHAMIYVQRHP